MKLDEKILRRFEELIEKGQEVLKTRSKQSEDGGIYLSDYGVDCELSHEWGASCLNILKRVFGSNSDHYKRFDRLFENFVVSEPIKKAMGIIKSAKEEYQNGFLFDTRTLIEAEVFDDFLEQAQYLFNAGYFQVAAVIAGCVLEDCLRKLCLRENISLSPKPKLDLMNSELAKKGIYNKLIQKKITALADLRNKAAHTKWGEFSSNDVEEMLTQVRAFIENFFS